MRVKSGFQEVLMTAAVLAVVAGLCRLAVGQEDSVPKDSLSPHIKLRSVSLNDVRWTDRLYQRWEPGNEKPIRVTLIPYYAWANRGISQMTVWLPACR
jgi:DUF1680 family protein